MTVISIGQRPPSGKNSEHQPRASITKAVPGLEEFIHRPCGMTIRPDHASCPHCDAVLKPATQEIKVAPTAPVRRTALGLAPTPTPATKEGINYLKNNRNRPIRSTNDKSITDMH